MNIKQFYLIFAFITVTIIALLYGVSPPIFADTFLQIPELNTNITHILRAVMGLYLALAGFWAFAAFKAEFRDAAILSTILFAGGLVCGRILSLFNDGVPSTILVVYIVMELAFVPLGIWVYRLPDNRDQTF